jgi:hypothetical protein
MDSNTATPTCIHCCEPIRPGAKRCPSCLSWQSRWAADSRHPGLEIALVGGLVVAMAIMVIAWAYLTRADAAKAPTGNQAASLKIVEANLEIVERGNRHYIVVVGAVSNQSDVALRDIYFFVQFLDARGNIIDASYARLHTMVVPAWSETPFKLPDQNPLRGLEEYASCSVEIRSALAIP